MKRKCFKIGLAFLALAYTSPASAFACGMPCHMSQKQMLQCAKAYSAHSQGTQVGNASCMKLELKAMPQFTGLPAFSLQAPEISAFPPLSPAPSPSSLSSFFAALRGPPLSPQQLQLSALPASNAPPALA